ncbi:hypothetical protein CDAR_125711 [Caerostris darwini]|uniref:Uncharacterized protein n=1 Tax=Caerostris darwini TaxID=1538125 RepID=A0AAV4TLN4_9ARAC|nr:hypothetical protein CDAR_125711 [Caerostris darwini]
MPLEHFRNPTVPHINYCVINLWVGKFFCIVREGGDEGSRWSVRVKLEWHNLTTVNSNVFASWGLTPDLLFTRTTLRRRPEKRILCVNRTLRETLGPGWKGFLKFSASIRLLTRARYVRELHEPSRDTVLRALSSQDSKSRKQRFDRSAVLQILLELQKNHLRSCERSETLATDGRFASTWQGVFDKPINRQNCYDAVFVFYQYLKYALTRKSLILLECHIMV